ncbi:hypothetical protein ACHHRT_12650 [Desulfurivibrio sp. D14AmB]|uniref:hypothetical protein n=1 Tax=Desulfurivibrio sp. D14AmB TaxID=3374370 RepID=UPI00376ECC6E
MNDNKGKRAAIGGIVGSSFGGKIVNCHSSCKIIVRGEVGSADVGGIAGRTRGTEVAGCTSESEIVYLPPTKVLNDVKQTVSRQVANSEVVAELHRQIDLMNESKDIGSFRNSYNRFVESAAKHVAVLKPIVDMLKQWADQ